MSSPPAPRQMAKRRASQKMERYREESPLSDDEPIVRSKRGARRKSAAARLSDTEEEEEEPISKRRATRYQNSSAEEEEEKAAGPSRSKKKSSGAKKGSRASGMDSERVAPQASGAKTGAASTARRNVGRSRGTPKGSEDAEVASEDEELDGVSEDGEEDLLQKAMDHYAYEAAGGSTDLSLSAGEEGGLVRNVMRFMIFRQQQKPGVPVKREDITKLVLTQHQGYRAKQIIAHVLKIAAAKFPAAFGMEMKEITLKTRTQHGEVDGSKVFVLRSLLPAKLRTFARVPKVELNQAFAMVVLPLIALAGGRLSEGDLGMQLAKIGVNLKQDHPALGKPDDQLQELVNKRLLAKSRETGPDGPTSVYAISSLALEDIKEERLTAFIDQVFAGPKS